MVAREHPAHCALCAQGGRVDSGRQARWLDLLRWCGARAVPLAR